MSQIFTLFRFNRCAHGRAIAILCGLLVLLIAGNAATAASLQFYGQTSGDVGRVKFLVGDTDTSSGTAPPGPPLDVGDEDFTIEFWIKTTVGGPSIAGEGGCNGNNSSANYGAVILDRDRYGQFRSYLISLTEGRIAFVVHGETDTSGVWTLCSDRNDIADNNWHHIAVQRRHSDGWMYIYIDGVLEADVNGPDGDISYPDDGEPSENECSGQPCTFSDPYLVIGAEKHDAFAHNSHPGSYSGYFTELRVSNVSRYSSNFTRPSAPFVTDANTVGLYHFDEGSGTTINDSSGAVNNPAGEMRVGGNSNGPTWSIETPFNVTPNPGTIRFSASSASVNESAGSIAINANRSGGSLGAVTVNYATANGTATAGADYTTTMGMLSWNDGQTGNHGFTVPIINDTEPESNETFAVTLSNATGAALGSPSVMTVTIVDNDSGSSSGGSDGDSGSGSSGGGSLYPGEMFMLLLLAGFLHHTKRGFSA